MSVFATGRPRLALLLAGLLILAQATLAVRSRDAHLGHPEQPQGHTVLEIRKIGGETTGLARQAERPEKGLDQRQQNRLEETGVDRLDTGLGDRTTGLAQAASGGHRGAASLLDPRTYRNAQYLGRVEVGGQHFQVLFDTGSALVLLNSDLCKAHACVTKNKYSGRLSPAHRDWQRSVSALFGNGLVKGRVASDTFSLAGLTLADQAFVQLEAPADTFLANAYFDGVVGLGLPGLAPPGVPAFMDTVQRRRLLPSTTFNFYFDRIHNLSRSYLSFGEPDLRFVGGALSYFPVVSDKYWAVRLARVLVGGKETALCSAGCTAILDTGSSLVSAPAAAAYQLLGRPS
jgi:hypothetical protein